MDATCYRIFVSVAPGLEELLEQELARLALALRGVARVIGGLEAVGDRHALWQLCRCSRLAEGVRVRVGRPFLARDFSMLAAGVERQPWHALLRRDEAVPRVRAHCEGSRLYHSDAVAERVRASIARRLGRPLEEAAGEEERLAGSMSPGDVHVRIVDDSVQLAVDACGLPLHRRGYRTHVGDAPLRETLAAACLAAAGYHAGRCLWDPFCGAGTLPLEAALGAWGLAPGRARSFAFERWPTHDEQAYAQLTRSAGHPFSAVSAPLVGSDRDPRVLAAAAQNTENAGLTGLLQWMQADVGELAARLPHAALVVCNPPYGERLGRGSDLLRSYRELNVLLRRRPDLDAFVLTGSPLLLREARGVSWQRVLELRNRGLPVRLYRRQR